MESNDRRVNIDPWMALQDAICQIQRSAEAYRESTNCDMEDVSKANVTAAIKRGDFPATGDVFASARPLNVCWLFVVVPWLLFLAFSIKHFHST